MSKTEAPKRPKRGMSKAEFAAQFDLDTRMRVALRKVVRELGADEILKDSEMRKECGSPSNGWKNVTEDEEFHPYQFRLGNDLFWASKNTVDWVLGNMSKARRAE